MRGLLPEERAFLMDLASGRPDEEELDGDSDQAAHTRMVGLRLVGQRRATVEAVVLSDGQIGDEFDITELGRLALRVCV